ncbi:probable cytochrome P450 4aa1 [Thrips palmi]|uniref:Probable cytochrome P450 4aa1 n=1 Tax=Thrips palmi TaxID=161013 RepID=A0A6P8ZI22_THRPL|nr:probable cytochrome P450 4aa1 [Thrips palmi]
MGLVTELLVVAVVATLVARFLLQYLRFRKMELAIPGPPSLPLLGNAVDFLTATPDSAMRTVLRLIGDRRGLCRFSIMNHLLVAVSSPDDIQHLVRRAEFNDKSHFFYDFLDNPRGLLQLRGADAKLRRRLLEPGFNKNVLNRFVGIFVDGAKGFVSRVAVDEAVDVLQPLRHAAARNFLRTAISADISQTEAEVMPVVDFFEEFHRSVNQRSVNPLLWSDGLFRLTPFGRKMARMRRSIETLLRKCIAMKRKEVEALRGSKHAQQRTIADILLDLHDRAEIPEQDFLDEIKTFFGANVETTVSALSWALKVLSILPRVQERVHAEVVAVLGDRDVTAEDLPQLKYLERVVKEVLRMFPPIPFTARQCHRRTRLCGHTVPAHSTVILNIHGAHFDPEHWREPRRFEPDRFLPENSQGRHHCAFIPFSVGARNCIGGLYAMMALTAFLATTVRAFRVLPADGHRDLQSLADNMAFDLTSRLVGGTRVRFQPRHVSGTGGQT